MFWLFLLLSYYFILHNVFGLFCWFSSFIALENYFIFILLCLLMKVSHCECSSDHCLKVCRRLWYLFFLSLKKFLGFYLFLFPHKNCLTRERKYYFIFKTSGFIAFKSEGILYNTFTLCIFLGFICDITYDEGIKFYIVH